MNKKEITPFPILLIRDRYHKKWVEEFGNGLGQEYLNSFSQEPEEIEEDEDISFPFGANVK